MGHLGSCSTLLSFYRDSQTNLSCGRSMDTNGFRRSAALIVGPTLSEAK